MQAPGGVPVVGVAWAGSPSDMAAFQTRHGLSFPSAIDPTGDLFARFGVPAQPAWVFVDASGKAQRVQGAMSRAALTERLTKLGGR